MQNKKQTYSTVKDMKSLPILTTMLTRIRQQLNLTSRDESVEAQINKEKNVRNFKAIIQSLFKKNNLSPLIAIPPLLKKA